MNKVTNILNYHGPGKMVTIEQLHKKVRYCIQG